MPTNPAADMTVELLPAGAAGADARVTVVADQVLTATPADVGKVVTVAADGTLELADAAGGGIDPADQAKLDFITVTQAVDLDAMEALTAAEVYAALGGPTVTRAMALTNETTSTTSAEQWGTEEVVFDNTLWSGAVTIDARMTGYLVDLDANEFISLRIECSIDGGSTWSNTGATDIAASKATGAYAADDNQREPFAANLLRVGVTPTGTIQVRATVTTPNGAGVVKAQGGRIIATVRPAHAADNFT